MKRYLILACSTLFFATSCLIGGGSPGSSSTTYHGTLTVSDADTGKVTYVEDKASIDVWIPSLVEPKFDFIFNKIKFDEAMPVQLNLEIPGVPFTSTISEDETTINYIFEGKNIIPTAGGTPYERFKISIIEGCIGKVVNVTFEVPEKNKRVYFTTAKEEAESLTIEE